ncbi:MAG: tRNA (cytidine(56)-2'-O)-methyltransferase [Candidatus Aenigmarchaeota archaeon]|nr:tRNA (cytidine(56)-2'-O)-methyltransferase [Candidatus Aenigmarchaeota archaeon]
MLVVLRLGHRLGRDERISTHCGLVARALGASSIIYSGDHDSGIIESIKKTAESWGGKFKAEYNESWRQVIKSYKKRGFAIAHLSMYGLPLQKKISALRRKKKMLVIIGSEKVPPEVYDLADFNISVTQQPHSEVAALALLLHEYFRGKELKKQFSKAKLKIIPQERGKKVEKD